MEVDGVGSVILKKLRDLLSEESFTNNQTIGKQLEVAIDKMRDFFIEAAKKKSDIGAITREYLKYLYEVEDSIDSLALRAARRRKRLGFLMRFTPWEVFSRKLDRIRRSIKKLNDWISAQLQKDIPEEEEEEEEAGGGEEEKESKEEEEKRKENGNEEEEKEKETEKREEEEKEKEEEEEEEETKSDLILPVDSEADGLRSDMKSHTISRSPDLRRHTISWSPDLTTEGSSKILHRRSSFKLRSMTATSLTRERVQQGKLMYSYSYDDEELSIVGYKRDVPQLRTQLEDDGGDRIISIVGKMGSGKTMLARALYGNRKIKKRFEAACLWVTVSKESTTKDLLLSLLNQGEKSKEQDITTMDDDRLKHRLRNELNRLRYLIVLDGVKSSEQWEKLKDAFPDDSNGSKILLTYEELFPDLKTSHWRHSLEKLDEDESWTLFLRKAGLREEPQDSPKDKIIKVCDGMPLNIVLLGSFLSTKKDNGIISEWNSILDSLESCDISDILMMSYNDLDAHLKLCLLYMMLFPKELDIPVRRLQRLWLAEGFVKIPDEDKDKSQEDVVQEYFDGLVGRSLIMVSKLRSDGSPRKCRLLGVVHDLLSAKARDISLFHTHSFCEDAPFGKRRIVENTDGRVCSLSSSNYQLLRSYISFNHQKKDTPARHVGHLVSNMIGGKGSGLLRVLDLEGVYKPSLPDNLGNLFNLRYLGLRWTFLDRLPKSVGELLYLETLDLKHTYINRIPTSIWKLKNLKHLSLNEVHLDKDMTLGSRSSLPELSTLWGLSIDHESPIKNGLRKLTHLRELGISFCLSDDEEDRSKNHSNTSSSTKITEDVVVWISELTTLRSLRLRSKDNFGHPANLSLRLFSALDKLSHMNLVGKLQKLPDLVHFPPNIKVLTLSVSRLNEDPMPILGQLRSLVVLRLLANSYLGENIVCPQGTFKALEVLKLWMLKDLKKWEVQEGAMEKLKELNIRCCSNLEQVPTRLLQRRTFKDLILTNMPKEFKEKVKVINNFFKVSITVEDYKFDSSDWDQADDTPNGVH